MQATYRKIKLYVINALMHHDIINIFFASVSLQISCLWCLKQKTCLFFDSFIWKFVIMALEKYMAIAGLVLSIFFVAEIICWLLYNNADNYFLIGQSLQSYAHNQTSFRFSRQKKI